MDFQAMIEDVRVAMGERPRRFDFRTWWRNRLRWPMWMERRDGLREVLRRQGELYRDGEVVWGVIVQANERLFQPVGGDSPASVVYALDGEYDACPEELEEVAARVQAVKGVEGVEGEVGRIVEHLKGWDRNPRIPAPWELSLGVEAYLGAVLVRRAHLPGERITGSLAPLLVHDRIPQVIIVPRWYWPEALVELWLEGA